MLRLAHFSDVHLTVKPLGWTPRDLLSKKTTGWVNVRLLGRGARFKHAPQIVDAMRREFASRGFDHLIFSGDATKLAFEREFAFAAEKLGVQDRNQVPCIAVPGNHDYYTRHAAKLQLFEKHFQPWLAGQRVGEHAYPFAKKVGDAWLIAVNSSTANWWTFDASGAIGAPQLDRLKVLCQSLDGGVRILVTHYPLRAPNRRPERRSHRLRDFAAALQAVKDCRISLWLHGHIHKPYLLEAGDDLPLATICAGSGTQIQRWCYNDYQLDGADLRIRQRVFNPESQRFDDGYQKTIRLKIG